MGEQGAKMGSRQEDGGQAGLRNSWQVALYQDELALTQQAAACRSMTGCQLAAGDSQIGVI